MWDVSAAGLFLLSIAGGAALGLLLAKKLLFSESKVVVRPETELINLLMSMPVASYSPLPMSEAEEVSEQEMTPASDTQVQVRLARQEEKLESIRSTLDREFLRVGEIIKHQGDSLKEHAQAVTKAIDAMGALYATKQELEVVKEMARENKNIVRAAIALICIAFVTQLISLVMK